MEADRRFPVMGCEAHVIVAGGPADLAERAESRLRDLEASWSRFLDTSEITALNRSSGRACPVSEETAILVRCAIAGYHATRGAFDPTVLGAVIGLGYDRSFDRLEQRAGRGGRTGRTVSDHPGPTPLAVIPPAAGAADIEFDASARTVRLPAGVGFDPGGIGKGLAADLVVAELMAAGAAGVCVNVGGDVRVAGTPPSGRAWRVGVEDPRGGPFLSVVEIADGAVATSSRARRRWIGPDGEARHHLVDPITATSARTVVLAATVVAGEGWRAEVLAKTAFLSGTGGRHDALALLERLGGAALLVTEDAAVTTPSWARFALPLVGVEP